jgi:ribosomal-protein-alanine N-acetyltransferase
MTEHDLDVLHALYADEELMRFITGKARTRDETRARLDKDLGDHRDHGFGLCVTELGDTGEVIGRCGLEPRPTEAGLEGELAWMFAKPWWGRGLATEAGAELIRYGLETLALTRVFAKAMPDNTASIKVMERLGMTRVASADREVEYEMRPGAGSVGL